MIGDLFVDFDSTRKCIFDIGSSQIVLFASQCFVYANNVEAWGGSGNASNLQRAAIGNIPVWLAAAFDNSSGIEITFEGETEATYYETDGVAAYYVGGPNPSGPVSGIGVVVSSLTREASCLSYYIPEGS